MLLVPFFFDDVQGLVVCEEEAFIGADEMCCFLEGACFFPELEADSAGVFFKDLTASPLDGAVGAGAGAVYQQS